MSGELINKPDNYLNAEEQYLVVIASCLCKRLDARKEPILASVIEQYPYANVYEDSDQKRTPGNFRVVGDGIKKRKIILIFSQIYPGSMGSPQDNTRRRLEWFVSALDQISEIEDLTSIAFPTQISRDGGGNWSHYYLAIKEFSQTLHLKSSIPVVIYHSENTKSTTNDSQLTQISLLNCINQVSSIAVDEIAVAPNLIKVDGQKKVDIKVDQDIIEYNPKHRPKKIKMNFDKLKQRLEEKKEEENKKDDDNDDKDNNENNDEDNDNDENNDDKDETNEDNNENNKDENKEQEIHLVIDEEADEKSKDDIVKLTFKKRSKSPVKELDQTSNFPITSLNPDWITPLTSPIVDESWKEFFQNDKIQRELTKTNNALTKELNRYGDQVRFLPDFDRIFNAFILCPYNQLKVVILGQDPYPNPDHAMGLAFSVPTGATVAQSLKNIYKEIQSEYPDKFTIPKHGNLEKWARQGVLLLNSALSIRSGERNSHQNIWKDTTDLIIHQISEQKAAEGESLVFMLWGGDAKKKKSLINQKKHLVLESGHPSPMSVKYFEGCNHFKLCNKKLMSEGKTVINWQV